MRKGMALLFAAVMLSTVGCGKGELAKYTSTEGKYEVLLYANPKEENDGKLVGNAFGEGAISVAYTDMSASKRKPEDLLQRAQERALSNIDAATPRKTMTLLLDGKHPGRFVEARLKKRTGEYRAKLYLVDGRLYIVQAVGSRSFVWSEDVSQFLDSFALTSGE